MSRSIYTMIVKFLLNFQYTTWIIEFLIVSCFCSGNFSRWKWFTIWTWQKLMKQM